MKYGMLLFTQNFGLAHSSKEVLGWALEYTAEAERACWDEVWTTEHHFTPMVQNPSALTMAAFLLGRTSLAVGTGVCVLPNHHPVALAEQAALLHQLSSGRFTLGVGRGVPRIDLEILGNGRTSREDIEESLALLANTLRKGKAAGAGPRYEFDDVQLVPDAPEGLLPALSVASPASARLAGKLGLPIILGPFVPLADKRSLLAEHAAAAAEHGHRIDPRDNTNSLYFSVDDDAELARKALLDGLVSMMLATTGGDPARIRQMMTAAVAHHVTGDPDECKRGLAQHGEELGVGRVLLLVEGVGSHEGTRDNIRRAGALFAR